MPATDADKLRDLLGRRLAAARRDRGSRTAIERSTGPGPVAPPQERMLFLDELEPGGSAYHLILTFRLEGPVDAGALERALRGIEERHEVLRSRYERRDGAETLVPDEPSFTLRRADLTDDPDAVAAFQTAELGRPFDLRAGPVWRGVLARTDDTLHHLVLTAHHIAIDGWSMDILRHELAHGYAAELGRGTRPAAPAVRYVDYAAWERRRLDTGDHDEQLAYWRQRLADLPPALELPTDRRPPQRRTRPGGLVSGLVDAELAAAVRALARDAGATPFMVLAACLQTLLHRYSGRSDFLVGVPVAGRTEPSLKPLIGLFVNTVVLRADCRPGLSFRDLLDRTRGDAVAAFAHQGVPFERVVTSLPPSRAVAGTPLFEVMLVWNGADQGTWALGDAKAVYLPCPATGTAKFDLSLQVTEAGDAYELLLEYDRELWDEASAARMLGHLVTLTRAAVAEPDRELGRLPLLDAAERDLADRHARGPVRAYPGPVDLAAMVAERAARDGDAVALVCDGAELTHRDLDRRANRLAHHLRALGVRPDQPVAVLLERSFDLVVAILGIVRSGGAYLPLDPEHPAGRSAGVLRDAGVRVVVTHTALAGAAEAGGCTPVRLDADATAIAAHPDTWTLPPALPDQLAYVFYTSGSTGRPKGVMVSHRAAHNQIRWQVDRFGIGPGETVLLKTNVTFDDSVVEVFAALAGGARLVIAEPGGHRDPEYLRALLAAERVGYVRFVPTMLAALLEHGGDVPVPALRVVKSAGEALPPELAARCLAALDAELYNAYGPTEAAVNVTVARCRPGEPMVTIGTPIENVRCHVLDDALAPQPVGVPGMLHLGGVQLARGYHGRPALTAEQFVPDPFGPPGGRLYRTGDLVRRLPDGRLDYLGRADRQVKVRGMRIELGEIESVLAEHPTVGQAVVAARDDRPGGARLVAYLLPSAAGTPDPGQLRGWLADRLPEYMVPAAFTVLAAFPLLPSGKVDRRSLPDPEPDAAPVQAYEPPRGDLERAVAEVWAGTLGVERIGRDDSFFTHGGHSLLAMETLLALRERLRRPVPLRLVFEAPTLAAFAARVAELPATAPDLPPVEPVRARVDGVADVSAAEARIWFADQLEPGDPAYNLPVVCRLRGDVDVPALLAALRALPDAHEALRTRFPSVDGRPVRVVAVGVDLPLRVVDLRGLDPAGRDRALAAALAEEAGARFDLDTGPLVRAAVLPLGDGELVLALTLHHIVADGWSIQPLLADLGTGYAAARAGRPVELPGRLGAGDYASWRNRPLADEARAAELAHWRERLAGLPDAPELPTDGPRDGSAGAAVPFTVPTATADRVRELARAEGCTPFMVLLAGYAAVLARHCATDEVVLTMPVADRGRPDLDGIVGLLLDTAVLRLPVRADDGFRRLLRTARTAVLDAQEHRLLPFDQVVDALGLDGRALARYAVSMDPLRAGAAPFADGVTLEPEPFDLRHSKADLNVLFADGEQGLGGGVVHRTPLFGGDRVRRLTGHLLTLLDAATRAPDAPLAGIGLLTPAERAELAAGGAPPAAAPAPACLHTLVLDQIARTPHAVALVTDEGEWTYHRLGERAARLARHLTAQGVRPGTLVGLCLGRGAQQPVAVLAVLLAGAAYVALDPAHPPARLRGVLADSGAVAVVTDRPWAAACAGSGLPTVVLADDEATIAGQHPDVPDTAATVDPAAVAYLVYTSGSTGRPKGVRTPHAAAAAYLRDYLGGFGLGVGDTVLQLAGLAFDACVRDLLGPLTTGARVVLLDDERAADPQAVVAAVDRHGVTAVLSVVPTLLRALLTVAEQRRPAPGGRLRLLLTAGEALDRADCARAGTAFAGRPTVVNQYGPTEATMTTTSAPVDAAPGERGPAPLGVPVAGARVWIVDRHGDLAPAGVPGEVWIGGGRLADGYHGQPALTAASFVPDPFSGVPGARAYRTGDLARRAADGTLTFLGRGDDQVKIRGHRVEPAGVESVLRTLPGVEEAAVVPVRGDSGVVRLVGCVAPATLDADAIRAGLRGLLPEYQVPAVIRVLPALPRTPNNKVDRRLLAALDEPVRRSAPPRTPTEAVVADVFTEVLGDERVGSSEVGRDDDFFARGGHSLLAARLAARLHRATGHQVPLREVLDLRTVAALAGWLDRAGPVRPDVRPDGPATPDATAADRPTPGQESIWRHCRREPDTAAYNVGFTARVVGEVDEVALARALDALADRHPALRTRFPDTGAGPGVVVAPRVLLPLNRHDVSGEPDPGQEALRRATAELRAPFDLERGPLARAVLIRCGPREHLLGLTVHHIVADGWTLSVLQRDLAALHDEFAAGRLPELPPVPGFAGYAAAQLARLDTPRSAADATYWRDRLRDVPTVLPLPTDRPRPPRWSLAGSVEPFTVDPAVAAGVRRLADETGATGFVVLLAAFQRWLHRLSAAERFLVAVPVANRPDPESERVAGPFANIVPVPADLRGAPTFRELVGRVRETFLEVWEHRELPYEQLVTAYADAAGDRPPLCQAMFAVQNLPPAGPGPSGLTATPLLLDRGTCRYELHMRCHETPDGLAGWLEYSTALFDRPAVLQRLRGFRTLLAEAVTAPDDPGAC
ncbi:amino acid adenylation domain-containing protein [Micromonospora siamensis]|uniref:Amino acid adenylation domain-containing protein n=1 Tax=Micromonospora siamensis TaxID=299152 RepID=A0A1C5I9A9_9ACTN|nr:non-ribosomal peptide synthetase [Micromonospora siamensis]SCG54725.1 amino acid adenylation domain-containing protein [Micromonospora siamensis]